MPQRIRELLDDAVADLEPRNHDPVGEVIGRNRAARRRTMLAGALAAILVAGGLVVGGVVRGRPDVPVASVVSGPIVPHVVDGVVVAGALRLPVPAGWQVKTVAASDPCGRREKTVLLFVSYNAGCVQAPIEVFGSQFTQFQLTDTTVGAVQVAPAPVPVTLRGGEPAWMLHGLDAPSMTLLNPSDDWDMLRLPWSRALVALRGDATDQRKVIASMWSVPALGGPLVLPRTAAVADLTVPDARGRYLLTGYGRSADPATVRTVLDLLRKQQDVVAGADACAGPDQRTARLWLAPVEGGTFTGTGPPSGAKLRDSDAGTPSVVITVGDKCQEAVSSAGGRVRLSTADLDQLKHLLGIEAK